LEGEVASQGSWELSGKMVKMSQTPPVEAHFLKISRVTPIISSFGGFADRIRVAERTPCFSASKWYA
jgi:hypothetical protein